MTDNSVSNNKNSILTPSSSSYLPSGTYSMDRQPPHSDCGNQKTDDNDAIQTTSRRTPSPEDTIRQQRSSTKRKRHELHQNHETDGSKQNTKAKTIHGDNSLNNRVTTCAPDSSQEQEATESYVTADNSTPGSFAFNSTSAPRKVALSSSNNITAVLLENQPENAALNPSLFYKLQAAASLQHDMGSTPSKLPQQKQQQLYADQKNSLLTSDNAPLDARSAGIGSLGLDDGDIAKAGHETTSTKAGPQHDDTSISASAGKGSTTMNANNDDTSSSLQHNARNTTSSRSNRTTPTATSDILTNMQQPQSLFLSQQQQQQQEQLLRMLGMINPAETTSPRSLLVSNNNRDSPGNDAYRHLGHDQPTSLQTTAAQRISSSLAAPNLLDHSNPLLLQLLQTTTLPPISANNLSLFSSAVPVNPQTSTVTSNSMLLLETLIKQDNSKSGNITTDAAAADRGVISSNFADNMISSSSGDQQGMMVTPNNTNTPFSGSSDTGRMSSDDALLLQRRRLQHSLAMQQLQQDQYELQYRMLLLGRSNIDAASFDGAQHGILGTAAGLRANGMIGSGAVIGPSSQQSELMNLLSSGLQGNSSNIFGGGGDSCGEAIGVVSPRIGSNTMTSATTNTSSTVGATTGTSSNNFISSTATSGDDLRNDSLNRIGHLLGGLPTTGLASFAVTDGGSTSFGDLPPVPPSQNSALFNSTTNRQIASDGFPVDLPTPLALPEDLVRLSAHQVFLRQQIEAFRATEDDASTHTRGRNKPIRLGQVGIRCRYCAHISVDKRQKGSTYFPATVLGIYQAAQNMCTTHLQCGLCSEMPESVKQEFSHLLSTKSSSSGAGRPYWGSAAESLGLVNTENYGIRFVRDSFSASSGGEPPRIRNSVGSNLSHHQKQAREERGSKSD